MSAVTAIDPTVDIRELEYYEKLASVWWDSKGPFWPLHRLNAFRIDYIHARIGQLFGLGPDAERPFSGLKVLDVGCGGGLLSESMCRLGAAVTAIDIVDKNIRVARMHAFKQELDIEYRVASASQLLTSDRRFDLVLNMEVVEHVAQLDLFVDDCCRLVRPGGTMILSTINRTVASLLTAKFAAEYVLRWLPRGTHQWRMFRRPAELEQLLVENRLTVMDRTGVRLNPLNRRFSYTNSLAVNYMITAKRLLL